MVKSTSVVQGSKPSKKIEPPLRPISGVGTGTSAKGPKRKTRDVNPADGGPGYKTR